MLAGVAPEVARPADRMRALGEDRWELKVVIDAACQRGIEQLRGLLSHVDPHLTVGQLVERLVQDGLQRYDPGRPPRGRGGGRREASAGQTPEPKAQQRPAGGAASPAKRDEQELPGVPPADGTSAGGSTPAPAALSAEEPARGIGGARTSAVAALPVPPSGRVTCGGSTPVRAKPVAVAPGTATSAAKSVADCRSHATVPTPRPTPPADQCMPTALAAVDRGRSAPSPAKRVAVAQLDGHSRPQPEAAGVSGGSTQPPDRTRRSPVHSGTGAARGVAPRRRMLQLRRSVQRAALWVPLPAGARPHRSLRAWRQRRAGESPCLLRCPQPLPASGVRIAAGRGHVIGACQGREFGGRASVRWQRE